jgi:miniconductance mechanosensitive channel
MTLESIQTWILTNPYAGLAAVLAASVFLYLLVRWLIGRVLRGLAARTTNIYDDLIVESLHPFRVAWLAPLILIYFFSDFTLKDYPWVLDVALFGIIWITTLTLINLLNAVNEIYEKRPGYSGVSIQGYLDVLKLLLAIIALILSGSIITGESPLILLSGVGAAAAILLLVFRDTILSIVASFQIAANDLVKEGDWIEVPSYEADGDVVNMSLHTIKVLNFDKTTTVIPTYKMVDTAFKNYRSMQVGGGRRIKRALMIDMNTIRFCTADQLRQLSQIDLIAEFARAKLAEIETVAASHPQDYDWPLDGSQITNLEIFHEYTKAYLSKRGDIHTESFTLLLRNLAPTTNGLPMEVYVFTRTTEWAQFEAIQASIFNHLIAALPFFDLMPFQQPSGRDFSAVVGE